MSSIQQIEDVYAGSIYESWTNAFANLRSFIVEYNEPIQIAKDEGKEIEAGVKTIKSSVARTAEHMLRLYLHQLSELNRLDGLSIKDLPPLRTNTGAMASLCNCTDRTIQNHREFLSDPKIGLIVREEGHGKYGLRIWLNPKLFLKPEVRKLWISEKEPQKDHSNNPILAGIYALKSTKTKIFHPLGHVLQDHGDNTKDVEKLKESVPDRVSEPEASDGQDRTSVPRRTTGQGSKGQPEAPKEPAEKTREKEKKEGSGGAGGGPKLSSDWSKFCYHYIASFWIHAKHLLYPGEKYTESEDLYITRFLWRTLFEGMPETTSKNEYLRRMEQYTRRLELAQAWLKKPENRTFILPIPTSFFQNTGKVNFARTASWWHEEQKKKIWTEIWKDAQKYKRGNFNLTRKGKKGDIYRPTERGIYKHHIEKLEKLMKQGYPDLRDRLHHRVANDKYFYRKPPKTKR